MMMKSPWFVSNIRCYEGIQKNGMLQTTLYYPIPDTSGDGVLFSIDSFVYIFLSFYVSLLATLQENGWTDSHEIFREGAEWPWDALVTYVVNSEKPRDAMMCNTGTGFVVLSHHSLFFNIISTEFNAFATFLCQTVNSTKIEIFCLSLQTASLSISLSG